MIDGMDEMLDGRMDGLILYSPVKQLMAILSTKIHIPGLYRRNDNSLRQSFRGSMEGQLQCYDDDKKLSSDAGNEMVKMKTIVPLVVL